MSKQPDAASNGLPYDPDAIQAAFAETGWSADEGWFAYRTLGGTKSRDAYKDWVEGKRWTPTPDLAFVTFSINRRLQQLGKDPMLVDLPFPRGDGGDGLPVRNDPYVSYCRFSPFGQIGRGGRVAA